MKKKIEVFNYCGDNLLVKNNHSEYVKNAKFPCFSMDIITNEIIEFNEAGQNTDGWLMGSILRTNKLK